MTWHRTKLGNAWIPIIAALSLLLSACAPAIPRQQVEQEVVPFILGYILPKQGGSTAHYTESSGGRWADAPANASLVVWAPPLEPPDSSGTQYLKTDQANKVWWYADQKLVEVVDKQEAIKLFRQAHFSGIDSSQTDWAYYEFGILALSRGNREAKVYVAISCGPLCGSGVVYTLRRNDTGTWEVKESQMVWIS